jgi:hypothetical protein
MCTSSYLHPGIPSSTPRCNCTFRKDSSSTNIQVSLAKNYQGTENNLNPTESCRPRSPAYMGTQNRRTSKRHRKRGRRLCTLYCSCTKRLSYLEVSWLERGSWSILPWRLVLNTCLLHIGHKRLLLPRIDTSQPDIRSIPFPLPYYRTSRWGMLYS